MRLIIVVFMLSTFNVIAQHKISGHGSYSLAAVCKNGILIASDSRLSLDIYIDNKKYPLAYVDTFQKIFPLNNMTIVVMGQLTFDSLLFAKFINEFDQQWNAGENVSDNVNGFLNFMLAEYPKYSGFDGNQIIFAGYQKELPYLYVYANRHLQQVNDGTIISDEDQYFRKFYNDGMTAEELVPAADSAVTEYMNRNEVNRVVVGKPAMILKINPDNSSQWLRNMPTRPPIMTVKELCNKYMMHEIEINFWPNDGREVFLKYYCN